MKKGISIILFLIATVLLIHIQFPKDAKNKFCQAKLKNYVSPLQISGAVVDKFIDKPNHALPRIVVKQNDNNTKTITIFDIKMLDSLYSIVNIGDSIYKSPNDLVFRIVKDSTVILLKIGCN